MSMSFQKYIIIINHELFSSNLQLEQVNKMDNCRKCRFRLALILALNNNNRRYNEVMISDDSFLVSYTLQLVSTENKNKSSKTKSTEPPCTTGGGVFTSESINSTSEYYY